MVLFVLSDYVGCELGARSLHRCTERKLGAARDSFARCEVVNVFERLRKLDQHSEGDLKLVILNFEDELAVKHEDFKRVKHGWQGVLEGTVT